MMDHFTQHNVAEVKQYTCLALLNTDVGPYVKKSAALVPELRNRNVNQLVKKTKLNKGKTDVSGLLSEWICFLTATD